MSVIVYKLSGLLRDAYNTNLELLNLIKQAHAEGLVDIEVLRRASVLVEGKVGIMEIAEFLEGNDAED